ncbi:piRNA biogenesis protein EXD1 [Holothuria leucospilota]|uniref:PiRNA biogenesis protein EXD1 n=1 Tax=Holothuria leucospilota TaxID=206669 RepID=A0A9Q1CMB5_HOLLE|nr:piRNA biogenesis protein EXD1 [Holothuria leucospilota]
MASRKQPRTPEAMRGINGVVVSLSLDKHACIIMIDELRGKERNLGIFDTSRLEERLEGVSSLNQPYFIAKSAKLKFMIAIPMTLERKQELGWDKGDWEIVSVQPYDSRRDVRLLPQQYFVKAGYGRGDYSPTMAYCRQDLPHTSETGPSPEMIGHIIHLFRKLVGAWNNFPVREILTVIKSNENFSDVREYFQTLQDIVTFLKRYPQYFSLKDANKTAFIPNRFMENKLYKFLASNAARSSLSEKVDVEFELIESVDVCKRHVARFLDRVSQSTSPIIAFGCEGIHPGKEGSLTLLQIGTVEGEVFIFDLLATPKREDMFTTGGLKRLLEEKHIKKVMYDCRDPQAALFFQFGVVLKNVFDVSRPGSIPSRAKTKQLLKPFANTITVILPFGERSAEDISLR